MQARVAQYPDSRHALPLHGDAYIFIFCDFALSTTLWHLSCTMCDIEFSSSVSSTKVFAVFVLIERHGLTVSASVLCTWRGFLRTPFLPALRPIAAESRFALRTQPGFHVNHRARYCLPMQGLDLGNASAPLVAFGVTADLASFAPCVGTRWSSTRLAESAAIGICFMM